MIDIHLNEITLEVGDRVLGSCLWTPSPQENTKQSLQLTVGWRTEGRGDKDQETLYETIVKPSTKCYFDCKIPQAGPVTYDGQLIRIIWEVSVTCSQWLGIKKNQEKTFFLVVPRQIIT